LKASEISPFFNSEVSSRMSTRQARRRQQRTSPGGRAGTRSTTTARSSRTRSGAPWWASAWFFLGAVAVVVAVIVIFIVVGRGNNTGTSFPKFHPGPLPAAVVQGITGSSVDQVSSQVGTGGLGALSGKSTPGVWKPIQNATTAKVADGKPLVFYFGAEYCPYCAAERWSLTNAVSRFGQWNNLRKMASTTSDVFPDTQTMTYYRATYSSPYITLQTVEDQDRNHQSLQQPNATQQAIISKYDSSESFPFIYVAGQGSASLPYTCPTQGTTFFTGFQTSACASNDLTLFGQPRSYQDIVSSLAKPSSEQANQILGNANWLTAGICLATKNQPSNVCSAKPIPSMESTLKTDGWQK
jgi:thiol-disulfide isomerase/thioredoxin